MGPKLNNQIAFQRRGTKALLVAILLSQCFALLRYTLLARILGPEQLGFAATLVLTASFFDLISDMAADRFLIQDKDGNDISVQEFVQLVLVSRGLLVALGLLVSAWPLAYFFKAPALAPALAALGLNPLITAFIHLDMRRAQRRNDFRAEATSMMISECAGLAVTVLAAYLTGSYVSVIYGLLARSLALVVTSHVLSERRYSLKYYKEHVPRLARFSTPLMITGMILFFAGQGDRILVARNVGFTGLGLYSAVLLLIMYPASALQKFIHTMFLPLIATARTDVVARSALSAELGGQTILLSLAMAAGFALVAPPIIPLLYGHRFAQSSTIVALIGILQSARFLVLWPTTIALAMGRSNVVLANNILRLIAWPAALVGVFLGFGLIGIVLGFIFGELVANSFALILLNRSENQSMFCGFNRFFTFVAGAAAIFDWAFLATHFSTAHFFFLFACSLVLIVWIVRSELAVIRKTALSAAAIVKRVL